MSSVDMAYYLKEATDNREYEIPADELTIEALVVAIKENQTSVHGQILACLNEMTFGTGGNYRKKTELLIRLLSVQETFQEYLEKLIKK